MKIPVRVIGEPRCRYCEHDIELDDSGWGMAADLFTGDFFYYHIECYVSQPDYIGGLYE